ncbi:MAG: hypothetical protein JWQ79_145, partial [Mucilaginibacter sp.]|nr:hypothetical protein [Mucilaginibacter sp.]
MKKPGVLFKLLLAIFFIITIELKCINIYATVIIFSIALVFVIAKCNYNKRFRSLFYFVIVALTLGINTTSTAAIIDWTGANLLGDRNNWNNAGNWSSLTVPGINDDVRIGVSGAITNMPIIGVTGGLSGPGTTTPVCKSITFGSLGPQSTYTYGTLANLSLTINPGYTLTVTGNVVQNHFASATGNPFNYLITTIAGTGTLICQNFNVGDALTQPAIAVADVAQVSIQISQLTINGNVLLNSNGNTLPTGNGGICYPWFSVEKGTTTLKGTITFQTNNAPVLGAFNSYNPGNGTTIPPLTIYKGYGLFTADRTASSPSTLELQAQVPISKTDNFYVYFTFGGNNGTTIYDFASTTLSQTVYIANEPSLTTTQSFINTTLPSGITTTSSANYYNLTLSGTSTKAVDANSAITGSPTQGLTVGKVLITTAGAVALNTNNPTVTVSDSWTNNTNVTQGSGNITITNALQNNTGIFQLGTANLTTGTIQNNSGSINGGTGPGIVTVSNAFQNQGGTYTCNAEDLSITGISYLNTSTFTPGTGTVYFTSNSAQTLTDNTTGGTLFNKITFSGTGGKTMSGTGGGFHVSSTGILTTTGGNILTTGGVLTLNSDASG